MEVTIKVVLLVWCFHGMMKDLSDKFTIVFFNRILFEITGLYHSALNETWILSEDWNDSEIYILVIKCFCSVLLAMHISPTISSQLLFLHLFANAVILFFCSLSVVLRIKDLR